MSRAVRRPRAQPSSRPLLVAGLMGTAVAVLLAVGPTSAHAAVEPAPTSSTPTSPTPSTSSPAPDVAPTPSATPATPTTPAPRATPAGGRPTAGSGTDWTGTLVILGFFVLASLGLLFVLRKGLTSTADED